MGLIKSPASVLERSDSKELRERIPSLSPSEARKLGVGKSTLYYLKKHARDRRPFKVYQNVAERLKQAKRIE